MRLLAGLLFALMPLHLGAADMVLNQASLEVSSSAGNERLLSNRTQVAILLRAASQASLSFYEDSSFNRETRQQSVGQPLNLQLDAAGCNLSSQSVEEVTLSLTSRDTGDQETVTVTETGPNTGVFRVSGLATAGPPATNENRVMELAVDDRVLAEVLDCSAASNVAAALLIDPMGVVFDSRSNQPVAGATVTLIDITGNGNGGRPGQAAVVYESDGVTPAPSTVVTGADGRYQFPLVAASQYQLLIETPSGYSFPSQFSPAQLPAGREIGEGSYGAPFEVSEDTGAVTLDVPIDQSLFSLVVDITAQPAVLAVGDITQITVTGRNLTGSALSDGLLHITVPTGYQLLADSVRLNGVAVAAQQQGVNLLIDVGNVAVEQLDTLRFLLAAGINASSADVFAIEIGNAGPDQLRSNTAKARLDIQDSFGQSILFGKVFMDCDQNRIQGPEEVGIPAVRLLLQNGDWAVTDSEGKYSFQVLEPRLYSLRLDPETLPAGAEWEVLSPDFAGDAQSRFVDLRKNELHKANFAVEHCHDGLSAEVAERRKSGEVVGPRLLSLPSAGRLQNSPKSLRAKARRNRVANRSQNTADEAAPIVTKVRDADAIPVAVDDALESMNNELAFVDLFSGQTVAPGPVVVRVKGPLGARLTLLVNDEVVADKQQALKQTQHSARLQLIEFRGIELQPGENRLELLVLDDFGNQRGRKLLTLKAPGKLREIRLLGPEKVKSDGQTPAYYQLRLFDQQGIQIKAPVVVTLNADAGRWLVEDIDPLAVGIQARVSGDDDLAWLPPLSGAKKKLGRPQLSAQYGSLSSRLSVGVTPAPRRLFVNGLLEAGVDDGGDAVSAFAKPKDDLRVALYADGNVSENWRLKASYDSDKTDTELFRQEQAEQFHPIRGDAALTGQDAQSSDDLYLRLDGRGQTLQWGDFASQFEQPAEQIGARRDVATGYRGWHQVGGVQLQSYYAEAEGEQRQAELAADGTSGPYGLPDVDVAANSEQVEILIRDRNTPGIVLSRQTLLRNSDYSLDAISGQILLRQPLSSLSSNGLNPQSLNVTYRLNNAAADGYLAGVGLSVPLWPGLAVSAAAHTQQQSISEQTLRTAALAWQGKDNRADKFELEWAQSQHDTAASASAWRALWTQQLSQRWSVEARVSDSEQGFESLGSGVVAGREEQSLELAWNSEKRGQWHVSWLSEDTEQTAARSRYELGWSQQWTRWSATAGYRWLQQSAGDSEQWRVGLGRQFFDGAASTDLNYIQSANNSGLRLLQVKTQWRPVAGTRLYATHEISDSLGNEAFFSEAQSRNSTQLGIESQVWGGAKAFSEYRLRDALGGEQAEAAFGVRHAWALSSTVKLSANAEQVEVISGDLSNQSTALSAALDYQPSPVWKNTLKAEWRNSDRGDRWLLNVGSAKRFSEDWSGTISGRYVDDANLNSPARYSLLRAGVAWRPVNRDAWNSLWSYEWREGRGNAVWIGERQAFDWHVNWQPTDDWISSGFLLHRSRRYSSDGSQYHFALNAIGGRYQHYFSERWKGGLLLAGGFDNRDSRQYASGVELSRVLAANLTLAAGYNWQGFEGPAIEDESIQGGAWLRLRFKFDENSFGLGGRGYE